MELLKIDIKNFRAIQECSILPKKFNVFLGTNNIGKTTIVEAINVLLNPEFSYGSNVVDENDFYNRSYFKRSLTSTEGELVEINGNRIEIEAVLGPVSDDEDILKFDGHILPWDTLSKKIIESSEDDPFKTGVINAIRIKFEALYSYEDDEFVWKTFFRDSDDTIWNFPEEPSSRVTKEQKLRIGFLIYRDVRGAQFPLTLKSSSLLSRVLKSQDALPTNFEEVFEKSKDLCSPFQNNSNFSRVIKEITEEFERFLPFPKKFEKQLAFELTDRTRLLIKNNAFLYVNGENPLPIHKFGAGTRCLSYLGLLTYIMRKRGRGILCLEEPESYLFPHAQRRIVKDAKELATQLFVTTHSPYVLEQFNPSEICRINDLGDGRLQSTFIDDSKVNIKSYERNLRKQLSEALLSNLVVIVEEESLVRWLRNLSDVFSGQIFGEFEVTSFDYLGISVISADGINSVKNLAEIIESATIPAFVFVDETQNTNPVKVEWIDKGKSGLIADYLTLEELLFAEIPRATLKTICTEAEFVKNNKLDEDDFNLDELVLKSKVIDFLTSNKGSIPFHEWMIGKLNVEDVPKTFVEIFKGCYKMLGFVTKPNIETQAVVEKSDV
jgi:putative ATP-dependent endonuclease of the OLD family